MEVESLIPVIFDLRSKGKTDAEIKAFLSHGLSGVCFGGCNPAHVEAAFKAITTDNVVKTGSTKTLLLVGGGLVAAYLLFIRK